MRIQQAIFDPPYWLALLLSFRPQSPSRSRSVTRSLGLGTGHYENEDCCFGGFFMFQFNWLEEESSEDNTEDDELF